MQKTLLNMSVVEATYCESTNFAYDSKKSEPFTLSMGKSQLWLQNSRSNKILT